MTREAPLAQHGAVKNILTHRADLLILKIDMVGPERAGDNKPADVTTTVLRLMSRRDAGSAVPPSIAGNRHLSLAITADWPQKP